MPLIRIYTIIISYVSSLPALYIGRKSRPLFWWYCLVSFIADLLNRCFIILEIPHGIITNLFLLSEWLLIGTYLTKAIFGRQHNSGRQAGIVLVAVGFIAWILYHGFNKASYSAAIVLYCIYISLLLACLYKIMRDFEYLQLEKSPLFMFCAVFLFFTAGSITLFGIKNYLDAHNPALSNSLWAIHNILNILKNSVLAYCIYLLQKQKK